MAFRKKRKDPFKEIQACLQKRDYKGALDWFNTLLQKDAKNTQIRLRFADTLVLAGHKAEAVKQFRVVADEMASKGFMIRAIAINKKILQLDPRQTDVHEKLAEMNEGRASTTSSRQSLADALTQPDAPIRRPTEEGQESLEGAPSPPPAEAPTPKPVGEAPVEVLPELSLEESMEMEFGAAGADVPAAPEEPAVEEPIAAAPPLEEPIPAPPPAEEEPVPASGGFELIEDVAPSPPATEEPAPELEEAPTFTEEPLELGESSAAQPEPDVITIDADAAGPEKELSLEGVESPAAESPEIVLEVDAAPEPQGVLPGEEMEVIELEVDSEPALAPSEAESLVGALGEDIDSLIDSIIDDVGSSAKGEQATQDEPPTHIPLFSDLTTAEFVDVAILLVRRVVKVGEIVVREGDPGDSMFIISTGEVRATVERDGQQLPVATLRDGDFFGEMAVLSGEPRTATVTAVKNTEVLELSRENLREICSRHPHVEAKIRLAYDERVASDHAR